MIPIEFFTKRHHFLINELGIFQNGELTISGKITIHHLILDEFAWLIVNSGDHFPDTFLKTDRVYSVLPKNEYYYGERCRKRDIFNSSFEILVQGQWHKCERVYSTENESHLEEILRRKIDRVVRSIEAEPLLEVTV